jgi:hypothetical protein
VKIIEAMNELKLTEKKLLSRLQFIQRYAARPSFRDDALSGQEAKKVAEAVQASNDLIQRHEDLKRNLDYTNLVTTTKINGKTYSLHSLILHKRFLCKLKTGVYSALNDQAAQQEVAQLRQRQTESKLNAQVVYNYDIQDRENKLTEVQELLSSVDSALQIANAKLDL